jgi:hypothetical protein
VRLSGSENLKRRTAVPIVLWRYKTMIMKCNFKVVRHAYELDGFALETDFIPARV